MKTALVLQHVPFEGPGVFHGCLTKRGYHIQTCLVPEETLPKHSPDFLLVMGGPMSVNDPDSWIQQELGFIQSAMSIGIPILGICLGAQFLTRALGGSVRPGSCFEIGMVPITLNSDGKKDPLFHTFPTTFEVFQWHGEGLDLPEQAVQLASSKDYEVQAFRFQEKVYGLLFHLEMEEQGVHVLCRECVKDVERSGVPAEIIKQEAITQLPHLHDLADKLIGHLTVPPNF